MVDTCGRDREQRTAGPVMSPGGDHWHFGRHGSQQGLVGVVAIDALHHTAVLRAISRRAGSHGYSRELRRGQ
ncbi:hypothetical protein MTO96_042376 [Rhipicephalus appendiculatus]